MTLFLYRFNTYVYIPQTTLFSFACFWFYINSIELSLFSCDFSYFAQNYMLFGFIHDVMCSHSLFIFLADWYSSTWIYHIYIFLIFGFCNNDDLYILIHVSWYTCAGFSLGMHVGVKLLDCRVCSCSTY